MKKFFLIPLFIIIILSCKAENEESNFLVLNWNLYSFFDSRDDGTEFTQFKHSAGYTQDVYYKRVEDLSHFLGKNFGTFSLFVFEEVESEEVLLDLLERGLKKRGFSYYGLADKNDGALAVGFISREKPIFVKTHKVDTSRLILDLCFSPRGENMHVLVLHASSQLKDENKEKRKEEFSLLKTIIELYEDEFVLVTGDFNLDPKLGEEALSSVENPIKSAIKVTYDKGERSKDVFYSPTVDPYSSWTKGTYYYLGEWLSYDNFFTNFFSFDGKGWEMEEMAIISYPSLLDSLNRPLPFSPKTKTGYSDHLPIFASFKFKN